MFAISMKCFFVMMLLWFVLWFWSRDFFVFIGRAQAIEAASDALHACRAEEQGSEFFSGQHRLGDRQREHVEEFRFVIGEVLHLRGVEFGFVVVHSVTIPQDCKNARDFFYFYFFIFSAWHETWHGICVVYCVSSSFSSTYAERRGAPP